MRGHVASGRRRAGRRDLRPVVASFVLLVGLSCAWAFAGITIRQNALDRAIARTQAEIVVEQQRQTQLEASAAEKKSADYVIEKARSLGWMWPWEAMVVVEQDRADANASIGAKARPSRFDRWMTLLFGAR